MSREGWTWLIIAIIALSISGIFTYKTIVFLKNARRTEARIIQMLETKDDDGDTLYAPVYTYTGYDMHLYTNRETVYSAPVHFKIGDPVSILYHKDNPADAKVARFLYIWLFPLITGLLGLIFLSPILYIMLQRLFKKVHKDDVQ